LLIVRLAAGTVQALGKYAAHWNGPIRAGLTYVKLGDSDWNTGAGDRIAQGGNCPSADSGAAQPVVQPGMPPGVRGALKMIHKGVEYTVTLVTPGVWKWQFQIGNTIKTGKTEAKLQLLAIRRVQLRIDRELKKASREASGAEGSSLR
jgi:hypothetical protein